MRLQVSSKIVAALIIALSLPLGLSSARAATVVFGTNENVLNFVNTTTNSVISTLQVTGTGTGQILTDIAYSPTGALYGISFDNLYTINTTTGAAALVHALSGIGDANALTFGPDGKLYAAAANSDNVYTLNTSTGAATVVNSDYGSGNSGSSGDLAFDGAGNLYLVDQGNFFSGGKDLLYRVNTSSAGGTLIGNTLIDNLFGIAFAGGTMWGGSGDSLYTISLATGVASLVGAISGFDDSRHVIYGAATPTAVPLPGALPLFGGGLGLLALLRRRRRSEGALRAA